MHKWECNVRKTEPYVPGEQPAGKDIIKLNTNENPYPPSPAVAEALKAMSADSLRKYPDPEAKMLTEAIVREENRNEGVHIRPGQIFAGVGSDDVLAMIFMTFFNSGKPLLFPDITYSFYDVWAKMLNIPYECCPLNEKFEIVGKDYYKENGGVIFPNPNAPTGVLLDIEEVEDIIKHNQDVIVAVDEAYIDFGGRTSASLLDKYSNLIVVKTFSKSRSLAGMRIGYALADEGLIYYLKNVKYSFNSYTLNQTAIELGTAAARDHAYFEETRNKIITAREHAKKELAGLGFSFPDSMANFLFVKHERAQAADLFEALKKHGIYVRYFNKPRIDNYLRITIGTEKEMEELYSFLRQYMMKNNFT